jgi:hypothetical protein
VSGCQRLSDRMPAVALGQAMWTPDDVQHLGGCPSCREEWQLVQQASGLGKEIGLGLPAGSTSASLHERLARDRATRLRRRGWSLAGLAAAATVAVAVWTQSPATGPAHPAAAIVAGLPMALPELDDLQPAELDSVLQAMDEPAPADSTLDELANFLDSWEG